MPEVPSRRGFYGQPDESSTSNIADSIRSCQVFFAHLISGSPELKMRMWESGARNGSQHKGEGSY